MILLHNALLAGLNPPLHSGMLISGWPSRPMAPTPDTMMAVPMPKASGRRFSEDHLYISQTANGVSWTCRAISRSNKWDRRSVIHDSRDPRRMVPSRGGVMTSRPKSLHKMFLENQGFYARTISVLAFDNHEVVHASSLGDFHSQKIATPVTEEPENLIVTLFRSFLLW